MGAHAVPSDSRFQSMARVRSKQHKKATIDDTITLFEQLSILLESGTPLLGALQVSSSQTESVLLADTLRTIATHVAAGKSFHQAAGAHPKIFSPDWIEVLRVGELSGQLAFVLRELNNNIRSQKQIRSEIMAALAYPVVLAFISVACVVVMLWKVVPTFAELFADFGTKLPAITEWVLALSAFVQANGLMVVVGSAVAIFLLRRYLRTPTGSNIKDVLMIAAPVVGDLVVQGCMQRFTANLSLLLRSGMPLLEALEAVRAMFRGNSVYRSALDKVHDRVSRGSGLAEALQTTHLFTDLVISMVRIGEQSGNLPDTLTHIAEFYRERVTSQVAKVTGLLEPCIVILMGVVMAVILASVYLPMFEASSSSMG